MPSKKKTETPVVETITEKEPVIVEEKDIISEEEAKKLKPEEVVYCGDDIPDYEVMREAGLPVAPADAAPEIKQIAKYICQKNGGDGIARDVIEQTMKAQGRWMQGEAFGW